MDRDDMVEEIAARLGVSEAEVAEVLNEQDTIIIEEELKSKQRKKIIGVFSFLAFVAGVIIAAVILDKKEKIDMKEIEGKVKDNVRKYTDMARTKIDEYREGRCC